MDEVAISRAITESFIAEFNQAMDVDVAIAGAGPSGMIAGYYLAKARAKVDVRLNEVTEQRNIGQILCSGEACEQ